MPRGEAPTRHELVIGARLKFVKGDLNETTIEITKVHEPWVEWKYIGRVAGRRNRRKQTHRGRVDMLITETIVMRLPRWMRRREILDATPVPLRAELMAIEDGLVLPHLQPEPAPAPEPEPEPEPAPRGHRCSRRRCERMDTEQRFGTWWCSVHAAEAASPVVTTKPGIVRDEAGRTVLHPRPGRGRGKTLASLLDEMHRRKISIDAIEAYVRHVGVGGTAERIGWTGTYLNRIRTHFGTQPPAGESRSIAANPVPLPPDFDLFDNWVRPMMRPENQPADAEPKEMTMTTPPLNYSRSDDVQAAVEDVTDAEITMGLRARLRRLTALREVLETEVEIEVEAFRVKLVRERAENIDDRIARAELALEAYDDGSLEAFDEG